jgi:ABC-type transport system substrate-binding protein
VIDDNTRRYEILVSEMKFTADSEELLAYFAEAEQILADQLVFIPLFQTPDAGVVWADEIAGYKHNATDAGDLWNVERWYRADA